jgi:hypothetical protein
MSTAIRAATPRPIPTPIPTFAPVLRPPVLEPSELSVELSLPAVGVEVMIIDVGVPLISVDDVVVSADVEAGEDPLLSLEAESEPDSDADSVFGRKPPCQSRLSPVALGRLTTFARTEASSNPIPRDVSGHQQGF